MILGRDRKKLRTPESLQVAELYKSKSITNIIDPNENLKKEKIESAKYFDASDCETLLNEAGITKNDFKTDKDGAVFWSTKEDDSKNMDAAQEWAKNNNAKTLEQTVGGEKLQV